MIGAIVSLILALICGFIGGSIFVHAMNVGRFESLPDQILMMATLIMSSIFLVGALILSYMGTMHRRLERISYLIARLNRP